MAPSTSSTTNANSISATANSPAPANTDNNTSNSSTTNSSSTTSTSSSASKRKASQAGLDSNAPTQTRSVKRRASKACQCCRARKVRCNVTEHGAPCTNCRLDEVECIVSESRRKKKWNKTDAAQSTASSTNSSNARRLASRSALDGIQNMPSNNVNYNSSEADKPDEHVPHSIYQTTSQHINMPPPLNPMNRRMSMNANSPALPVMNNGTSKSPESVSPLFSSIPNQRVAPPNIPYFIKPLPPRIGPDEIAYLEKKGALTVPNVTLRNELLRAYIDYVHPYMPLIDLYDFIMIIDSGNGSLGRISLILFQAVMFAGCAFVDMDHLLAAGYLTRKEARRDFFQKTRLLYDFDYESDRVSLVQALLLLTYYYETPDDQKDTWHWMGVATSVAHTIGLHRNPDRSKMDPKRTKLWKRIWWSTYMRDRLIALGMRRPTRIKTGDYDVPMLTLDDFEIVSIPESASCVPSDCLVARDVAAQRKLAVMCIEKAKLCVCISHVLSKQYCVLNNNQGFVNDRTTMMLLPRKVDPEASDVKVCDGELQTWFEELPDEARYSNSSSGNLSVDLNRGLLHMVFYTTLSALHRPQVLPAPPSSDATPLSSTATEILECSRRNVRRAAAAITSIAQNLDSLGLVRYLPTTGVTVLLPAIIIHLLDIKAPDEETRRNSLRGFFQCMHVMNRLRDLYAAADYSTAFLEAAIRKAGVNIAPINSAISQAFPAPPPGGPKNATTPAMSTSTPTPGPNAGPTPLTPSSAGMQSCNTPPTFGGNRSVEEFMKAGRHYEQQQHLKNATKLGKIAALISKTSSLTPPPDESERDSSESNVNSTAQSKHQQQVPNSRQDRARSCSVPNIGMPPPPPGTLTNPAKALSASAIAGFPTANKPSNVSDEEVARRLETFLASTPPLSDARSPWTRDSEADKDMIEKRRNNYTNSNNSRSMDQQRHQRQNMGKEESGMKMDMDMEFMSFRQPSKTTMAAHFASDLLPPSLGDGNFMAGYASAAMGGHGASSMGGVSTNSSALDGMNMGTDNNHINVGPNGNSGNNMHNHDNNNNNNHMNHGSSNNASGSSTHNTHSGSNGDSILNPATAALSTLFALDDITGKSGEGLMLWGSGPAAGMPEFEQSDFDSLLNLDPVGECGWDTEWTSV